MRHLSTAPSAEPNGLGFVFEVNGRAVLALAASNLRQARKLCAEPWFAEEMAQYQSDSAPVWPAGAAYRVRRARPEESIELQVALAREQAEDTYEKFVFAFLVPVDLRAN
jgi:hypothetical protein